MGGAAAIIGVLSTSGKTPDTIAIATTTTSTTATTFSIPSDATTSTISAKELIWTRQGRIILGDGAGDELGASVAISGDGSTLVVGAPQAGYVVFPSVAVGKGYVKIFHTEDSESGWAQLGQTLEGDADYDHFGEDVDISLNGTVIAVGAPGESWASDTQGYVKVYQSEGSGSDLSWKQIGQTIYGEASKDQSGQSVSLSACGCFLAIGANGNDGNGDFSGHVRVYKLEGSSWIQLGQDIDGETMRDNSGYYTSISANGKTIAIGATGNHDHGAKSGHARVYYLEEDNNSSSWKQLGQDIDGETSGDRLGVVALSADAKTLAVGAFGGVRVKDDWPGYTKVYYIENSTWNQIGQTIYGEANDDMSGVSLSLSNDGKIVAIGALLNDDNGINSGYVRVFRLQESTWEQFGQDINGESEYDRSGGSVAISSDGNTVAIGSYENADNGEKSGHVRVFSIEDQNISK